jgi:hypothetical protein
VQWTVDKQPTNEYSLVYVTNNGKEKKTKYSEIEYQYWEN